MHTPTDPRFCPDHLKESLKLYVEEGVPLGDFLEAVVANDLTDAVGRADIFNQELLRHIVAFVYHHVPMCCRGSRQAYESWIRSCRQPQHEKITLAGLDRVAS